MITEMSVLVFQGGYCFIDCDININLYTKKHNITSRSKVKIQFGRPLSMKMFEWRNKPKGLKVAKEDQKADRYDGC